MRKSNDVYVIESPNDALHNIFLMPPKTVQISMQ